VQSRVIDAEVVRDLVDHGHGNLVGVLVTVLSPAAMVEPHR